MPKELSEATESFEVFGFTTASTIIDQILHNTTHAKTYTAHSEPNIPSGFFGLDKITGGFQRGKITIISAGIGGGKTAFLLSLLHNIAVTLDRRVALFTPERSARKVISRLIENITHHSVDKIRSGNLKPSDMFTVSSQIEKLAAAPLFFDESKKPDAREFILRCYNLKEKHNPEIIFIDSPLIYLEHIKENAAKEEETKELTGAIKHVAQQLDIPIVCLQQNKTLSQAGMLPNNAGLLDLLNEDLSFYLELNRNNPTSPAQKQDGKDITEIKVFKGREFSNQESAFVRFIDTIDTFVNL